MTYSAIVEMGGSQTLLQRVAACAAEQGNSDPRGWAGKSLLRLAADPEFAWSAPWDSAKEGLTVNDNPDLGVRTDVIGDDQILAAVQARKTVEGASGGWPAA